MKKSLLIPLLLLILSGCQNEAAVKNDDGALATAKAQLTQCEEKQRTLPPEAVELQKKMADVCIRLSGIPIQSHEYPYMMKDCGFKTAYTRSSDTNPY